MKIVKDVAIAIGMALSAVLTALLGVGIIAGAFWLSVMVAPWGPLALVGLVLLGCLSTWAYNDRKRW